MQRSIEINPLKRTLRVEGALSGSIFTGTDKVRSGYGNGDCLYFDFGHRVFAVADGTERFPWASRDILCRLADSLTPAGVPETAAEWKSVINSRVYAGQKYQHKTTFSCVAFSGDGDEVIVKVAHGGDSRVVEIDSVTGRALFQTERNMVFAGRSKEIIHVSGHRIKNRNSRILIYSDGFEDFTKFCIQRSFFSSWADAFSALPIERFCEHMHSILEKSSGLFEHDDIGFMAIDPFRLAGLEKKRVLIGGTEPHEEKRFRAGCENGDLEEWVPHAGWPLKQESFHEWGITVKED